MQVPPSSLIACVALLLLAACAADPAPLPSTTANASNAAPAPGITAASAVANDAPTPAPAGAALDLVNGYLAAWNAHDASRAGAFLSEDTEYFDASFAGKQIGRQAVVDNAIGVFLRGMPDLHWEMRSPPIVSAGGVAYEWTLSGTHSATWGGIAATQQKVSLKGMSFVRVVNNKITYQAIVYDSATLNRQLGL